LKRLLIGLAAWLVPFWLPAQKVDNLIERIRSSPLPPEQREELERLFTGADFSRLEPVLEKRAGGPVNESASAVLYALAGAVEFLDGHMDRAVADFRLADRRAPISDADRFTLSMALVKLNDVPAARAELTRLKGSHPESPLYLLDRSGSSVRCGLSSVASRDRRRERVRSCHTTNRQLPCLWGFGAG
jgi:hypothetical protein